MYSFLMRSESQYALHGMDKFVVNGSEIHSDGCGNISCNYAKEHFDWKIFQCDHSKFKYVTYKKGFDVTTATVAEKINNNLAEFLWKLIDRLNGMKHGHKVMFCFNNLLLCFHDFHFLSNISNKT